MTMQQVTGPFADRSPQGAAPRAGQAGFAETTVFDCATGRALARVAVPEGWAVSGQLERVRSFERPMRVRVLAQGPESSRIEFQSGDRFCVLGAGVKGLGAMGAMYGITTSMQSSPERAFEDVETFLDKEAIAYAQRVGASIRLATTTGYPGGFDAAASGPTAPGPAAPDPAAVFGKVGAGEVLVWGSRNVVLLDCPEASLGFNAESVLPVFLRSFLPNPAIAQEADAMRQNSVIESQQQSAMAQQRRLRSRCRMDGAAPAVKKAAARPGSDPQRLQRQVNASNELRGGTMNATSAKRRALAATLAALLVAPLAGCGATANAPTTAPDASAKSTDAASGADILDEVSADAGKEVGAGKDKIPDTKSGETGWGSSADGSSSGEPSAGGDSASAGEASEFDTWGENCTDDRGNVTVEALLELKGWQLQTLLSQRGFTWNDQRTRYEDGQGRVVLAGFYAKGGDVNLLPEKWVGQLEKGAAGQPVAYYITLDGYLDGNTDESMALMRAVSGSGGLSCEDYFFYNGMLYALVYNYTLTRYMVVAAVNDDGTIGVTLFNDEVAKAGVLTTQGGSPRIIDVWNSYVSSL